VGKKKKRKKKRKKEKKQKKQKPKGYRREPFAFDRGEGNSNENKEQLHLKKIF
jgi:hypothetical protein